MLSRPKRASTARCIAERSTKSRPVCPPGRPPKPRPSASEDPRLRGGVTEAFFDSTARRRRTHLPFSKEESTVLRILTGFSSDKNALRVVDEAARVTWSSTNPTLPVRSRTVVDNVAQALVQTRQATREATLRSRHHLRGGSTEPRAGDRHRVSWCRGACRLPFSEEGVNRYRPSSGENMRILTGFSSDKNALRVRRRCANGGSCRIRTGDLRIKSPLLYQLS
jgi:hypothetical protein